jgi:outer membrane lipoprotein LolB
MRRAIASTSTALLQALHAVGIAALMLALAGCASVAPPAVMDSQRAMPDRIYRDAIELGGRLSVRYQQNGHDESLHGSFTWVQVAQRATVTILSPLGQTLATIEVTPERSSLTQAGRAPRVATDVDALAADALGWPLPVAGLRDWLQGFATDPTGRRVIASPSVATTVATPEGWRLHYTSWQDNDPAAPLNHPKRIDLERSTAQAGNVSIRIVIDSWQAR